MIINLKMNFIAMKTTKMVSAESKKSCIKIFYQHLSSAESKKSCIKNFYQHLSFMS